jgi:glutathione peroxidase
MSRANAVSRRSTKDWRRFIASLRQKAWLYLASTEIRNFCSTNFDVTFPLFSKIDVNGGDADPLYKFLKKEARGVLGTERIKWNFTKFLVDSQGDVIKRYAPTAKPSSIENDISALL